MCFYDTPTIRKQRKKPRKLDFVGKEPPTGFDVGWRAWRVKRTARGVQLLSPIQPATWKPGTAMTGSVHPVNFSGIYAFRSLRKLREYTKIDTSKPDVVVGQIVLWGEIAEHKDGFRAERGYPVRLWTNTLSDQSALRDAYAASVQPGFAHSLPFA